MAQLPLFDDPARASLPVGRTIRGAKYNLAYLKQTIEKSRYGKLHRLSTPTEDRWVAKKRSDSNDEHPLHKMAARVGAFPPALARGLIERYSTPGDTVLDPFSGKGTAVLEALLLDRSAIGNDIAPEAFVLTHAKGRPVDVDRALSYVEGLPDACSLTFRDMPEDVKLFYTPDTLARLLTIRERLLADVDSSKAEIRDVAMFTLGVLLGILHGRSTVSLSLPCSHYYSQSPAYVRKYVYEDKRGPGPESRNVRECLETRLDQLRADMPERRAMVLRASADELSIGSRRPHLILTSPPYFDVQKYAWDNWLRLWLLGINDWHDVHVQLFETESIVRYAHLLRKFLIRFHEVLSDARRARLVIVVGDARYSRQGDKLRRLLGADYDRYVVEGHVNTSEIVADVAASVGFEVEQIVDDFVPFGLKGLGSSLPAADVGGRAESIHGSDLDRIIVLRKSKKASTWTPTVLGLSAKLPNGNGQASSPRSRSVEHHILG